MLQTSKQWTVLVPVLCIQLALCCIDFPFLFMLYCKSFCSQGLYKKLLLLCKQKGRKSGSTEESIMNVAIKIKGQALVTEQ